MYECEKCYHFENDEGGVYRCNTCNKAFCKSHLINHEHDSFSHLEQQQQEVTGIHEPMVCGFENLGNSCYFNSNLHVLLSINEFVSYCLTDECDEASPLGHQFNRFIKEMNEGNRITMKPTLLRKEICTDAPNYLQPLPQDSVDFFKYQFKYIRKQLPEAPLNLAEFDYISEFQCTHCLQIFNEKENNLFTLIVKPPRPTTVGKMKLVLTEMVDHRFNCLIQKNWKCPNCDCDNCKLSRKIKKAPKYLFINNRLDYGSRVPDNRHKTNVNLEFDCDDLDISKHIIEGNGHYELIAFMHHTGRWALLGHDISFVRKNEDSFFQYNDNITQIINDFKESFEFGQQYLYLFKQK